MGGSVSAAARGVKSAPRPVACESGERAMAGSDRGERRRTPGAGPVRAVLLVLAASLVLPLAACDDDPADPGTLRFGQTGEVRLHLRFPDPPDGELPDPDARDRVDGVHDRGRDGREGALPHPPHVPGLLDDVDLHLRHLVDPEDPVGVEVPRDDGAVPDGHLLTEGGSWRPSPTGASRETGTRSTGPAIRGPTRPSSPSSTRPRGSVSSWRASTPPWSPGAGRRGPR